MRHLGTRTLRHRADCASDGGGAWGAGQKQSVGHDIALKVNVDRARIEDFLRLASHGVRRCSPFGDPEDYAAHSSGARARA